MFGHGRDVITPLLRGAARRLLRRLAPPDDACQVALEFRVSSLELARDEAGRRAGGLEAALDSHESRLTRQEIKLASLASALDERGDRATEDPPSPPGGHPSEAVRQPEPS